MKVVVLVKQTPDTAELPKVSADDVRAGKVKATMVINPWDEYAAEEAILLGDRYDVDSVSISMGVPEAADALKHTLAMGVGAAALVDSSGVTGGDLFTTAAALAEAIKAQGSVDLVLTGKQSVDDNSGAVFAGVAATLGWPLVTGVSKVVDISGGRVTVERLVEGGQETLSVPLPAVLSVGKEINDPRYPSFMGIRKASKANIPATPAGIAPNSGKTQWTNVRKPEERKSKVTIIDGASAQEKAAKLADALIADKVI